jgi:tRNA modification GTPase
VAIATPPGVGALGVVRLSGPDAIPLTAALVKSPAAIDAQPSHTVRRVRILDPDTGAPIDDALCTIMRAPRSYTGDDVVELSCHGGAALLAMVVERVCRAGARLAAPGEFTRRAFLNGRIDLARAEAVALLINARTERAVSLAARALEGELGARLGALREGLLDLAAGLEVSLDFPDDGVGIDVDVARARIEALLSDVDTLRAAARRGRLVHDGITIALVGRPNAGKSSLLNALLGRARAIVAPTPGTTRDVVEGVMEIAGVPVRLLDTAGLGTPGDAIEAEGMKRSQAAIDESDLVIVVVDGSRARADDDLERTVIGRRALLVQSKSDLGVHADAAALADAIAVSSITGAGLAALRARIVQEIAALAGASDDEGQIAATLRQAEGLARVARALSAAASALPAVPLEAALVDLREALREVSGLLGVDLGDAVLDRIFATFCVGK